jgi:hypothetical protein
MITRTYHFNEACYDYFVVDVETKEDGKKFMVNSFPMDWYNGKSNIPSVPRKEKPKEMKQ